MSNKLWYKWDEMRRDVNTLCRNITLDKFDPQVIVGLSRGGLTAGVMMSHWFQKPFKNQQSQPRDPPGSDPQHLDNCENTRYPPDLHFGMKIYDFGIRNR